MVTSSLFRSVTIFAFVNVCRKKEMRNLFLTKRVNFEIYYIPVTSKSNTASPVQVTTLFLFILMMLTLLFKTKGFGDYLKLLPKLHDF